MKKPTELELTPEKTSAIVTLERTKLVPPNRFAALDAAHKIREYQRLHELIACGTAAWEDGFPIEPQAWALDYVAIEVLAGEVAARREAETHE